MVLGFAGLQSQTIDIRVSNAPKGKALLSYLKGENVIKVDSAGQNKRGEYEYTFEKNAGHRGIYRLTITSTKWIDFVNDGEDVKISTDANDISDSVKVLSSESNKLYYAFIKLNRQYKVKTDLLQIVLAKYPKDDDYYTTSLIKLAKTQKEYQNFVNGASQKNPKSFIARYVRSVQLPVMDMGLPIEKQLVYLKAHTLDRVDFNDDDLIYSDAFTSKSIEYLTLFRNPQLKKEQLEGEFMVAVDTILGRAKVNAIVYQHVTEYFIDGFKKFGFDEVIDYIVDNYVIKDDICLDEKLKNSIQRRMDQARIFKIGAVVPGIVIPDSTGRDVDLGRIGGDKTLIVFYASWCPHCQEMLPKLNEIYSGSVKGGMKVLAISIDTSRSDWLGFVQKNKLGWINVSDLKGWYGKAAQDFYLYATPTMFLVNGKREIIAKPTSVEEVSRWMN
jgi:thiol-disulfide isomerase/thioredoxin